MLFSFLQKIPSTSRLLRPLRSKLTRLCCLRRSLPDRSQSISVSVYLDHIVSPTSDGITRMSSFPCREELYSSTLALRLLQLQLSVTTFTTPILRLQLLQLGPCTITFTTPSFRYNFYNSVFPLPFSGLQTWAVHGNMDVEGATYAHSLLDT